jgi:putative NAD(P)-binding protein
MNSKSGVEPNELPIVTVFGAGIAGLTAAHELVERGFTVQVVEPQESDFEEYECAVGGLATNQFTRVRAPISALHPWLLEPEAAENLRLVQQFRSGNKIEQTNKRFPLRQRIRFNKRMHDPAKGPGSPKPPTYDDVPRTPREPGGEIPRDWRDYWDEHGVVNWKKLDDVLEIVRNAAEYYMELYFPELAKRLALGTQPTDEEWENGTFFPIKGKDKADLTGFVAREMLFVRVVAYTDTDGTADDNRRLANEWAKWVRQELIDLNNRDPIDQRVWNLDQQLEVVVRGSANPRFDQSRAIGRSRSNRVEFEIVEQVIPGEHGFRFFPTFYRHLFDTMRRTPILDAHGAGTGSTAFDQLVPTPQTLLARDDGKGPQVVEVRRLRSIRELDETMKILGDQIGFTPKDLLGLQYYMLRYLLSGPTRRLREAEPRNVLQYIGGDHPEKRFSSKALDFINRAPRALAAMSVSESDARTQLDITFQLMAVPSAENITVDMTLNGPTSTAWLDHWKTYLKAQGVKFFVGRITSLQLMDDRFVPGVEGPDGLDEPRPEEANDPYHRPRSGGDLNNHRFVLALPFQRASDLIWAAYHKVVVGANPPAFSGPFHQLLEFDRRSGRRDDRGREARALIADRATGKPPETYPLRTISGVQYFFPQEYRFGKGNVYFTSAPWALTSISQFAYWRQRVRPVGPFLGQISVDVGDWHAYHSPGENGAYVRPRGNTAWYSSRQEIAQNVWQQINRGLATVEAQSIVPPRYFHIDRNIVFDESAPSGFQGSALLQISPPSEAARSAGVQNVLTFRVSFDKWKRYEGKDETHVLHVPLEITTAQALADLVNQQYGKSLYAFVDRNSESQVFVSPIVRDKRIVAAFRGASNMDSYTDSYTGETKETSHYIYVDGKLDAFTVPAAKPEARLEALDRAVEGFAPKDSVSASAPKTNVRPLDRYYRIFEFKRDDGEEVAMTFASRAGGWEVVDGPRLDVRTSPHNIRLINAMDPGSGWVWSAAVRSNAVLRVPAYEYRDDAAPTGLQPGRLYGVGVGVGVSHFDMMTKIKYEAVEGDTPTRVRDQLLVQLREQASDVVSARSSGETDIILSPVGAPALTVEVKDLYITPPSEGFVVLRNDAEFLINIRDQWQWRPGLCRGESAAVVPKDPDYARLAGFSDKGTEIFYGHNCRLLEHWVAAGTYMATYTRITTMEAANESGRHAASAIIYSILQGARQGVPGAFVGGSQGVLVGDFPQIWNVEDQEPADLRYFTELDEALCKDNLPHILDILSVTRLVEALLELDLKDSQVRRLLARLGSIFDSLKPAINQGVLASGQAFGEMVGAHRDLVQSIFDTVTEGDPISQLTRNILGREIGKLTELSQYYKKIWGLGP